VAGLAAPETLRLRLTSPSECERRRDDLAIEAMRAMLGSANTRHCANRRLCTRLFDEQGSRTRLLVMQASN
jgi:hypothetical protein